MFEKKEIVENRKKFVIVFEKEADSYTDVLADMYIASVDGSKVVVDEDRGFKLLDVREVTSKEVKNNG